MNTRSDHDELFHGLRGHLAWEVMQRPDVDRGIRRRLWHDFPRLDQYSEVTVLAWAGNMTAEFSALVRERVLADEASAARTLYGLYVGPPRPAAGLWRRTVQRIRGWIARSLDGQ